MEVVNHIQNHMFWGCLHDWRPPQKYDYVRFMIKSIKSFFPNLEKKHQISSKIGQNESPESENFFPGVF